MIMGHFQLLIVLLKSDAYIPKSIADYVIGMDFSFFSFSFLHTEKWILYFMDKELDYQQSDSKLKFMGLDSGSSTVNNSSLFLMFLLFLGIHIAIAIVHKKVNRKDTKVKKTKFKTVVAY